MRIVRRYSALVVMGILAGAVGPGVSWGASSATLDTLDGGVGSLSAGAATYSDFSYGGTTLDSTVVATASVDASGNPVITFTRTSGTWTETDGNSVISFHVAFTTPMNVAGLDFVGTANGSAVSSVGETINDGVTHTAYLPDLQVFVDGINSTQQLTDLKVFPGPVTSLDVTKSIDIAADGGTGTITSVDNTFGVPEPASLGVLGVGAAGVLLRRRRR